MKPLTSEKERRVEAVLNSFETIYIEQQSRANSYPLCLPTDLETKLIATISPHLGNVPSPAKITEILSEVQDLHRLDGRCLEFEGEEYEPGDDGYGYALSDHEDNRRDWIRYLINQEMK